MRPSRVLAVLVMWPVLVAAGCASREGASSGANETPPLAKLAGVTWTLVSLNGQLVQQTTQSIPDFLERTGGEAPEGRMTRLPTRGDVDPRIQDIREQLIIEFCSR